ncbi:MAG: DUF1330 domain-containing protein [Kangiellaceae bacterium]|nr:DUF1330 domain-containing protein [Kangiellaceae bacterium]
MTNADKTIVVIEATFNPDGMNTPEFKEYSRRSNANGEAHGGVVIGKYQVTDNLGNGDTPHLVLVIEYPSEENAKQTFTNSEYLNILPLRHVAFKQVNIFLTNTLAS